MENITSLNFRLHSAVRVHGALLTEGAFGAKTTSCRRRNHVASTLIRRHFTSFGRWERYRVQNPVRPHIYVKLIVKSFLRSFLHPSSTSSRRAVGSYWQKCADTAVDCLGPPFVSMVMNRRDRQYRYGNLYYPVIMWLLRS